MSRTLADSILASFMAIARTTPAAVALSGDSELSYGALADAVQKRARELVRHGVTAGGLVAVVGTRSAALVTDLLAVWQVGAGFVALDPDGPPARTSAMLADARPQARLDGPSITIVDGAPHDASVVPSDQEPRIAGVACVVFTSGTTGRPKGVILEHRGLVLLADGKRQMLGLAPGDRVAQAAPLSADAFLWEVFPTLAYGATLVLQPQGRLLAADALADWLREVEATEVALTPTMWRELGDAEVPSLRTVVAGGERCPEEVAERWAPGRTFANAYGPTESTVCTSMAVFRDRFSPPLTIGVPLPGIKVSIRPDSAEDPDRGELCVSGPQVARGYLDAAETAKSFGELDGEWTYRTGDWCARMPDGSLRYRGRRDRQLNVRGVRIEAEEIERVIEMMPAVRGAAVTMSGSTPESQLVAFVIGADGGAPRLRDVALHSIGYLPLAVVPRKVIPVTSFPRTGNGKVDFDALLDGARDPSDER
jgi:amino acid adenylation domain-containing protein